MVNKINILFLVVFIQLNFVIGWSQENQRSINNTIMERPIITPEFEKLNLDDFKDGLVIKHEDVEIEENKFINIEKFYYDKQDNISNKILRGSLISGFAYSFTPKDSFYTISKSFYTNYIIQRKSIRSSIESSIKIGKQYFFDKEGKLEKTIDHDLGWDFSYEKIIQYILDRKASLFGVDFLSRAKISKQGTSRKYWELELDTSEEIGRAHV